MNRGLLIGTLCGIALSVGAYASSIFDSPLQVFFVVLCMPGALLDDLMTPPPMRAHSPHWFFVGTILSYGLVGLGLSLLMRNRPKKTCDRSRCDEKLTVQE